MMTIKRASFFQDSLVLCVRVVALGKIGHLPELASKLVRSQALVPQELDREVERGDLSAARVGIEADGELRDLASGLVGKRRRRLQGGTHPSSPPT